MFTAVYMAIDQCAVNWKSWKTKEATDMMQATIRLITALFGWVNPRRPVPAPVSIAVRSEFRYRAAQTPRR